MERKCEQCIFLKHWMECIANLDLDLQDKIMMNYVHYQFYGTHLYDEDSIIVSITNLWVEEIRLFIKEGVINNETN